MESKFHFSKEELTIEDVFNEINTFFYAKAQSVLKIAEFYRERAEKCGCKQCRRDYRKFIEDEKNKWRFDKLEGSFIE